MSAWVVRKQWSASLEIDLARHAARLTKQATILGQRRFVCEDLILAALIDFAKQHELPVRITNGQGVFDPRDHRFATVEQFRDEVFKTTGADDLVRPENTIDRGQFRPLKMDPMKLWSPEPDPDTQKALERFGMSSCVPMLRRADPGDMLLLKDLYTGSEVSHCQLILRRSGSELRILQGNFRTRLSSRNPRRGQYQRSFHPCLPVEERLSTIFGGGPGDPRSQCYLGQDLEEGTFRFEDLSYQRASQGSPKNNLSQVLSAGAHLRRWNVQAFA